MKTDYTGKVDTGIMSFFTEVSKEIVHQTTGHVFADDERKSVLADTNEANDDAINSAIDQQATLDNEISAFNNSLQGELAFSFDSGDSDDAN